MTGTPTALIWPKLVWTKTHAGPAGKTPRVWVNVIEVSACAVTACLTLIVAAPQVGASAIQTVVPAAIKSVPVITIPASSIPKISSVPTSVIVGGTTPYAQILVQLVCVVYPDIVTGAVNVEYVADLYSLVYCVPVPGRLSTPDADPSPPIQ